jgi:outer membrane protein with beta-barrel domain
VGSIILQMAFTMFHKIIYSLVVTSFLYQNLYAENNWIIKGGFNYSDFSNIQAEPTYNYSFGVERNIPINSFFSISPEILWSKQGALIKNKPVWNENYYDGLLFKYDINIVRTSMDLALVFDFPLIVKNNYSMSFRFFPSFHTESFTKTKLEKREQIDITGGVIDWDNYDFEYIQGDYDYTPYSFRTSWSLNIGLSFSYRRLFSELRYMNNLQPIGQVGQLRPLKHKLHSFHFLFGIIF